MSDSCGCVGGIPWVSGHFCLCKSPRGFSLNSSPTDPPIPAGPRDLQGEGGVARLSLRWCISVGKGQCPAAVKVLCGLWPLPWHVPSERQGIPWACHSRACPGPIPGPVLGGSLRSPASEPFAQRGAAGSLKPRTFAGSTGPQSRSAHHALVSAICPVPRPRKSRTQSASQPLTSSAEPRLPRQA